MHMRKDAQLNRERIVDAARTTFAEQGVDAPLEEIARRAGVGIATLYRRFPSRESLVEAVFADLLESFVVAAERALEADDAWEGFTGFVLQVAEQQARDRGVKDVLMKRSPNEALMEDHRRRGLAAVQKLVERAQAEGSMRPDVTAEDAALLLWANAPIIEATVEVAPDLWRRFVTLMLDSFRIECAARPLPEAPLTGEQLFEAMACLGRKRSAAAPSLRAASL
jgi:AcrR family transcriptional regulator